MQKRGATCIQTAARWRHCAHTLPRAVPIENLGNHTQPQAVIGDVSSAEAFDTAGMGLSSPALRVLQPELDRASYLHHIHPCHARGPLLSGLSSAGLLLLQSLTVPAPPSPLVNC
jgi:hypothetical protein